MARFIRRRCGRVRLFGDHFTLDPLLAREIDLRDLPGVHLLGRVLAVHGPVQLVLCAASLVIRGEVAICRAPRVGISVG